MRRGPGAAVRCAGPRVGWLEKMESARRALGTVDVSIAGDSVGVDSTSDDHPNPPGIPGADVPAGDHDSDGHGVVERNDLDGDDDIVPADGPPDATGHLVRQRLDVDLGAGDDLNCVV